MPAPVLEVKNLSVRFHHAAHPVTAVDKISFTLEKGKTLGIVGESGSGKSLTALSILKLLPPQAEMTSQGILFTGGDDLPHELSKYREKQMAFIRGNRISMIFQEPMTSLNPVMRCGKQLAEAIRAHRSLPSGKVREQVLQLFREVLLPRPEEIFRSYPHELSGGQKQRVMIAMAIACAPDILIADEPTTALDVTVQKAIIELILQLQQKYGMAILFITHDLDLVKLIAGEVLVMKSGRIVESGRVETVFASPVHAYTQKLLASRNFMKDKKDAGQEEKRRKWLYSGKPLLKVEELKAWFPLRKRSLLSRPGTVKAVDGVSFEIFPGETVGLVGESGCGKTTLGRSILRLIEPSGGRVIFSDAELTEISFSSLKKRRKNMQIIFQDPYSSLNPRMTAGRAIMEPMIVHKLHGNNRERKARTLELMARVGLEKEHFDRYPHEFSGGQRQRVCIARALAVSPDFIVCDESVSALDVSVQAVVLNLLNELKREFGFTYLFISHDLSVVKFMSDRIIVMRNGNIEESGDADEIYHHPKSLYTKNLIEAIPK